MSLSLQDDDGACVYVLIVTTAGPEAYFKIGMSLNLDERINAVQTGCPLPIDRVLYVPTRCTWNANLLEAQLHRQFKAYRSSGEWFVFDITDPAQKQAFKGGCAAVFDPWRPDWKWQVFDEAQYRREREALRAGQRRLRMNPDERAKQQRRRNAELAIWLTGTRTTRAGKIRHLTRPRKYF